MLAWEWHDKARLHPDADESPIFVIGTGRSGSTLLRQMLNAHPRISITHEAFFYAYADLTLKNMTASAWLERYFQTFSFAWLRLDPDEVRNELPAELPKEEVARAYRAIMRCKARQSGKPRFGEKSPLDNAHLKQIFEDFANPRVVFIVRDPRATVASMARMPFTTSSTGINSWACDLACKQIAPFLDRIYEIRLEDLAADPRATMQGVLDFVGEPWDDAVLEHTLHAPSDDIAPFPWFRGATRSKPAPSKGAPAWRNQLSPAWIRMIEKRNRTAMERYRYTPATFEREPNVIDKAAAVMADVPEALLSFARVASMARGIVRHFKSKIDLHPQQGMEEHLRLNRHAKKLYPDFRMPVVPTPRGFEDAGAT